MTKNNAHAVCLIYKLLSSRKIIDDLSNAFHRSFEARGTELKNNKTAKEKF